MKRKVEKLNFYFPGTDLKIKGKAQFGNLIMAAMRKDGGIKFAGYLKEKDLKAEIINHLGENGINLYESPSVKEKNEIEKLILATIEKCHKALPHPDLPIFVFVYPWFPKDDDNTSFDGTTALAAYYTLHLFINLRSYTQKSIKETITHEWNHLVFYRYYSEHSPTLRVHMAMEGMAEVFMEEVSGGNPSPWATALSQKEAEKEFIALSPKLNMRSAKIYREIFFGSKTYKRWTGYSIGYRLVKEFRKKHPDLSWEEMIKMDPEKILENRPEKRA